MGLNMRKTIVATLSFLTLPTFSAFSAETPVASFKNITGKVLVNTGNGFVPATPSLELQSGNKVLLGDNSSAKILFIQNGCSLELIPAAVTTITDSSMCQQAGLTITPTHSKPTPPGVRPVFVGTAFFAATLATVVYAAATNDDDTPVSGP